MLICISLGLLCTQLLEVRKTDFFVVVWPALPPKYLHFSGHLLQTPKTDPFPGQGSLPISVLGVCWGTEELGWNEGSRKKITRREIQPNGFGKL